MRKGIIAVLMAVTAVFVAVWWATSEREIPRIVLEKKLATPPSQFMVLGDGTRIHYRDRGPRDAPAVILLHGFAGSLFVWEYWSATLSNRFRVVSLDLPGNGLTGPVPSGDYSQAAMAETVKAVAARLGLKNFALAGNSMGGAVAARYAEMYPQQVTALILIDASGVRMKTRPRFHFGYYLAHVPVLSRLVLRRFVDRRYVFHNMVGMGEAMTAHFRLRDDTFIWDNVGKIKASVLILWGADDRLIPLTAAHAWQDAIPGARLIVYSHAGHVAMADAPDRSVNDAGRFLESVRTPFAAAP